MTTATEALKALDFGRVDSESEPDLEQRFVRTADFDRFLDPRNTVIVGAKGSGKSALFEMFSKHLPGTRRLAGDRLTRILVATGTGFGDLTELTTADIQSFQALGGFQYDSLWKVYIALKSALALGRQGYSSQGPLRDLLRITKEGSDYRIGPLVQALWRVVVGNAPGEININFMGVGARITAGRSSLDVLDLLADVQAVLEANNQRLWLLFDKIDEIHPTEQELRNRALEGLFPACMAVQRAFPNIVPRVFIRSDLYGPQLTFTNKSHLDDKQFEIAWDAPALRVLLLKRAFAARDTRMYLMERAGNLTFNEVERLSPNEQTRVFNLIFDERAYPGKNEAPTLNWMIARAADAKGGAFPRELIAYGNISRARQLAKGGPGELSLISGRAVVDAYYEVSRRRCETYLSEFPNLQEHFRRFRGRRDAPFRREELVQLSTISRLGVRKRSRGSTMSAS